MEIIKRKNGTSFREKVTLQNGKTITKSFRRKTDAIAWKRSMEVQKIANSTFLEKHDQKITFEKVFNDWMNLKIRNKRGYKTVLQYDTFYSKHFKSHFGDLRIAYIQTKDIDQFVSYLLSLGLKPKSINNVLTLLKQVFKFAHNEEIIKSNPCKKVDYIKEPEKDVKYFTDEEIKSLLNVNRFEEIYPILVIALNTGMRIGEIFGLCWDCINFEKNLILVKRTATRYGLQEHNKTLTVRHVPMNDILKDLFLELMRHQKNPKLVMTNTKGELLNPDHYSDRNFKKATIRASVRPFNFHCLRHTYASQFMMKGGNIYDLQAILGHSDLKTTMIYAHLSPQHLVKASQIISYKACEDNNVEKPKLALAHI